MAIQTDEVLTWQEANYLYHYLRETSPQKAGELDSLRRASWGRGIPLEDLAANASPNCLKEMADGVSRMPAGVAIAEKLYDTARKIGYRRSPSGLKRIHAEAGPRAYALAPGAQLESLADAEMPLGAEGVLFYITNSSGPDGRGYSIYPGRQGADGMKTSEALEIHGRRIPLGAPRFYGRLEDAAMAASSRLRGIGQYAVLVVGGSIPPEKSEKLLRIVRNNGRNTESRQEGQAAKRQEREYLQDKHALTFFLESGGEPVKYMVIPEGNNAYTIRGNGIEGLVAEEGAMDYFSGVFMQERARQRPVKVYMAMRHGIEKTLLEGAIVLAYQGSKGQ